MKNVFSQVFDSLFGSGKAWWVEVKTGTPACTYYFGPFEVEGEAETAKKGYVEDLELEGAQQVQATVLYCKRPQSLTVYDVNADDSAPKAEPALSGRP
ncbi:MAG: DUF1816 domain-containing protein [Cyanobacteria bacterium P01_F01_bin.86]